MIVVLGRVRTDAGRRAELIRIAQTLAQASRQESGCIGYRLYEDTEVDNDFVFVEEWESQEVLREHFKTPHIAEFTRAAPAVLVAPPDVQFHTIESTQTLADVTAASRRGRSGP